MEIKEYTVVKVARGEYQLVDDTGLYFFTYPVSKWDASQKKQEIEVEERLINDERIQKVVKKFITKNRWEPHHYGSIEAFIRNYTYKMYHREMRAFLQKPSSFLDHIQKVNTINKQAREQWLIDNQDLFKTEEK